MIMCADKKGGFLSFESLVTFQTFEPFESGRSNKVCSYKKTLCSGYTHGRTHKKNADTQILHKEGVKEKEGCYQL